MNDDGNFDDNLRKACEYLVAVCQTHESQGSCRVFLKTKEVASHDSMNMDMLVRVILDFTWISS